MRVALSVNGAPVSAEVEPRLQLADFLREHCLLTGTHIGCEHGVCGACTILLDGAPARSCIAYTAACQDADVRTIEGLEDDPVTQCLRVAFRAEHALQCGYCTPGMLVTARDIVLRLPQADEARIRLELAGNLCRCTGYAGIVRAIARVLREQPSLPRERVEAPALAGPAARAPALQAAPIAAPAAGAPSPAGMAAAANQPGTALGLSVRVNRPLQDVWSALHDPALLAACVPGARLRDAADSRMEGEIQVALGPITAVFAGSGTLTLDATTHHASLFGEGCDSRSGTLLSGTARFALSAAGDAATNVRVELSYALRGPLAQLARAPVVQAFAATIGETVARNLEQRLGGERVAAGSARLRLGALLLRMVRDWLLRRLHRS